MKEQDYWYQLVRAAAKRGWNAEEDRDLQVSCHEVAGVVLRAGGLLKLKVSTLGDKLKLWVSHGENPRRRLTYKDDEARAMRSALQGEGITVYEMTTADEVVAWFKGTPTCISHLHYPKEVPSGCQEQLYRSEHWFKFYSGWEYPTHPPEPGAKPCTMGGREPREGELENSHYTWEFWCEDLTWAEGVRIHQSNGTIEIEVEGFHAECAKESE